MLSIAELTMANSRGAGTSTSSARTDTQIAHISAASVKWPRTGQIATATAARTMCRHMNDTSAQPEKAPAPTSGEQKSAAE